MSQITCPSCSAASPEGSAFCGHCGRPLPPPVQAQPVAAANVPRPAAPVAQPTQDQMLHKYCKTAFGWLLAVAIIQAVATIVLTAVAIYGNNGSAPEGMGIVVAVMLGVAAAFAGLAIWARTNPFPAALTGLLLYLVLVLLDFITAPEVAARGWFIKLMIVLGLISAVAAGNKYRQAKLQQQYLHPPGGIAPTA